MSKQILVAYATGAGSTAEVAAAIGDVLAQSEARVVVQEVKEVEQVDEYSAVVVGSSIRVGEVTPCSSSVQKPRDRSGSCRARCSR